MTHHLSKGNKTSQNMKKKKKMDDSVKENDS